MCSFLLDSQSLARWHLRHMATFVGTSDLRHEGAYRNATSAVYEEYLRLIDPHGARRKLVLKRDSFAFQHQLHQAR